MQPPSPRSQPFGPVHMQQSTRSDEEEAEQQQLGRQPDGDLAPLAGGWQEAQIGDGLQRAGRRRRP